MQQDLFNVEKRLNDFLGIIEQNFSDDWLWVTDKELLPGPPPNYNAAAGHYKQHTRLHINQCEEMIFVLEGSVFLQVNHDIHPLNAGQCAIVRCGVYHNELVPETGSGLFLWVTPRGISSADPLSPKVDLRISGIDEHGEFIVFIGVEISMDPLFRNLLLDDLPQELASEHCDLHMLKSYVLQTILLAKRKLKSSEKPQTVQQWETNLANKIIKYIETHPGRVMTPTELSNHFLISTRQIGSIFKSVTGKTVTAYINEYRINRAKELLRENPKAKVKDFAELLGYYDQYHFCKAFKKATGISPSQYRSAHKQH